MNFSSLQWTSYFRGQTNPRLCALEKGVEGFPCAPHINSGRTCTRKCSSFKCVGTSFTPLVLATIRSIASRRRTPCTAAIVTVWSCSWNTASRRSRSPWSTYPTRDTRRRTPFTLPFVRARGVVAHAWPRRRHSAQNVIFLCVRIDRAFRRSRPI